MSNFLSKSQGRLLLLDLGRIRGVQNCAIKQFQPKLNLDLLADEI